MSLQTQHFYDFGPFRLNAIERRLLRDGRVAQLAPKALDALLVLVESGGRVVERGELIKRIWPDSDADETNLAVMISSLRKALGERPDGGAYIETVPKQGYRFAVSVVESLAKPDEAISALAQTTEARAAAAAGGIAQASINSPPVPVDRSEQSFVASAVAAQSAASNLRARRVAMSWLAARKKPLALCLAAVFVGAVAAYALFFRRAEWRDAAQPRRLAILPFRNLKPDSETDFLGFSLADATITKLSYVGSIVVRPSSYVEKYRDMDVDPKEVASELNVDTLMTGTFLKEGGNLRIMVQLIDVKKSQLLSKFPFDTRYEKLRTVQDKVARNIIDRLQLDLTAVEDERLNQTSTESSSAYEYYLRGIDMYSRNEFREAVIMLETAVDKDANFALAWAHLGRAYTATASFDLKGRAHHHKAEAAYEQALKLNSDLIEATIYKANLLTDTNQVEQAVPMLRELLGINPNNAEARWELGYAYRFAGMLNESIEQCERARAIDPKVKINSSAFNSYLYTGQYEKFLKSLPAGDAAPFIVFYKGMGNYYLKNFEQAAADFDRAYEMNSQWYNRTGKALSYAIRNERLVALDILRDVEKQIEQSDGGDAEGIYKVAQVYAVMGEKEAALRVLRRSIEQGFFCYDYFKSDQMLENIRSEPAFNDLMEIARNRHEQFKRTFF